MEFETAKARLREGYQGLGFKLVDEHERELYFARDPYQLCVRAEDIEGYAAVGDDLASYEQRPNQASIVSKTYREQLVRVLDPIRPSGFLLLGEGGFLFGTRDGGGPYVEIGPPSDTFFNRLRLSTDFVEAAIWRSRRVGGGRSDRFDFRDFSNRLPTIKVFNLSARSHQEAVDQSDQLIHAAFFELAYLKRLPLGIVEEWPAPPGHRRHRSFRHDEPHAGRELPLPRSGFNRDIVRFYLLGMSSNVPVLQFLSFYQVLEYFFVSVSDERLYQQMTRRVNDPRFSTEARSLDRLIQDVVDHKRVTDETEMLKLVLEKYVDENELIEFIKAYEEHLGEPHYTKRRKRFGVDAEVKPVTGHVFGNVAKVVKTVRNALVHSSDHHERVERHVPFSEGTRLVEIEVPLLRFLAERVIISTAT